jgi:ferric-dicitrate binding protein FerR (iron transport regulator)
MEISDELMERYFSGKCNSRERHQVIAQLKRHPEILRRYLTEESWDHFSASQKSVPASFSMLAKVEAGMYRSVRVRKRVRWVAAAAVLIICSSVVSRMLIHRREETKPTLATVPAVRSGNQMITRRNNSGSVQEILLPDNSVVRLQNKSEISYSSGFENNRDIYLTGNALFRIAKNKRWPFTVRSQNISITALGTVFRVNGESKKSILVRLFEGRIVIREKQTDSSKVRDIYLLPGQEYVLNTDQSLFRVLSIRTEEKQGLSARESDRHVYVKTFNNRPLAEVFHELEKNCHIRLIFEAAAVKDRSFSGSYNGAKEPVSAFISNLALINQLNVRQAGTNYYITEKP